MGSLTGFPGDVTGFPKDVMGFSNDVTGFPGDVAGFPQNETGFPGDVAGFPEDTADVARMIQLVARPLLVVLGSVCNVMTFCVMRRGSLGNISTCFYIVITRTRRYRSVTVVQQVGYSVLQ